MGEHSKRPGAKDNDGSNKATGLGKGRGPGKSGAKLSGSNVGRVLRTAYDDALREPVPDDFLNLLGKLD